MPLYTSQTDNAQTIPAPRMQPEPAAAGLLTPSFTRAELREIVLELMG